MKKEKDGSTLLVVLMIIMIILMCAAFVGLFLMMKQANELRDELDEIKEEKKENKEENKAESSTKCKSVVGAYYAEVIDTNLHMKQTYSFSEDGSYITFVENGGATNGTYTLSNGTIYFTQKPELGPENETATFFYEVSDDCKTIYVKDEYNNYELKRIEE